MSETINGNSHAVRRESLKLAAAVVNATRVIERVAAKGSHSGAGSAHLAAARDKLRYCDRAVAEEDA